MTAVAIASLVSFVVGYNCCAIPSVCGGTAHEVSLPGKNSFHFNPDAQPWFPQNMSDPVAPQRNYLFQLGDATISHVARAASLPDPT